MHRQKNKQSNLPLRNQLGVDNTHWKIQINNLLTLQHYLTK